MKTRKRLSEALSPDILKQGRKASLELLQGELALYDSKHHTHPDLAVWLGFIRGLGMIHQTHHWQTSGDSFYGDHLMFERFYKAVQDEVDTIGEKIAGIDSPKLTNCFFQLRHIHNFVKKVNSKTDNLLLVSLAAEIVFIETGELITERLKDEGLLTSGIANMLGDILDRHESHVYLLNQRLASVL